MVFDEMLVPKPKLAQIGLKNKKNARSVQVYGLDCVSEVLAGFSWV